MNGHNLYTADDFKGKSYEELENNKTYELVVDGGLAICKICGEFEAGLDKPCKQKAKVINDFEYEGKNFKKNELYEVKVHPYSLPIKDAVFIKDKWFCDVGSPIFKENFVLVN